MMFCETARLDLDPPDLCTPIAQQALGHPAEMVVALLHMSVLAVANQSWFLIQDAAMRLSEQ